jgi:predicted dehydrogenase
MPEASDRGAGGADTGKQVRIGVLGAARIAPAAVVAPARALAEAEIVAVAARDPQRARAFAERHGIPKVHATYDALLDDPDVDAVYNPLPNSLHGRWSIAAAQAGKHVLCEKPFTADAEEAERVASAARAAGTVVMEGMHYRFHPLAARMREIVLRGELGEVRRVEARLMALVPKPRDIRYRLDLAGGATMDVGCYAIHQVRTLAGAEPTVTGARAKLWSPGVDRWMRAELALAGGATGRITCALLSGGLPIADVVAEGELGTLRVLFPNRPQLFKRIDVRRRDGTTVRERVDGDATFSYQLRAFCGAVLRGDATEVPPSDSIANMRVVDAVYEAAGLEPRRPSA